MGLPSGIDSKEINSFLELSIEEFSPFPPDQLYWGFIQDPNGSEALIYATRKENQTTRSQVIESSYHVFPSFLPVCKIKPEESPRILTYFGSNTVSFLFIESKQSVPSKIINEEILIEHETDEEETEPTFDELLAKAFQIQHDFFESLDTDKYVPSKGIICFESARKTGDESISCVLKHYKSQHIDGKTLEPLIMPRGLKRWNSDIRPIEFKLKEQRNRNRNRQIWKSFKIGAIVFSLLIIAELLALSQFGILKSKTSKIDSQRDLVKSIEAKQEQYDKIDHFSAMDLRPFYMMGLLNKFREENMYFQSIAATDINLLEIRGIAPSVNLVNTYISKLNEDESFEDIDLKDVSTRRGQVQFTLSVRFNTLLE